MRILGIDPGAVLGGLPIIERNGAGVVRFIAVADIPTIGTGAKERIDARAVCDWIAAHGPQHAAIERAQAMPRQGASSGFKFGRGVGAIEAAVILSGVPMTIIEPTAWKKFHGL